MIPRDLRRALNEHYGSTELETESVHFAERGRPLASRDAIALYTLYKQGTNRAVVDYVQFIERCAQKFALVHHHFAVYVKSFNRHPDARRNPAGWAGIGLVPAAAYLYTLSKEGIGGDVLECGVFLGGSTCCLSQVGAALDFDVYAADSYEGLPKGSADGFYRKGDFAGRLDVVLRHVRECGAPAHVIPVRGYFDQSLKDFSHPLRAIVLDTDLYSSSRAALDAAFARLDANGIVLSDGIGLSRDFKDGRLTPTSEEARAVHEFFRDRGITYSGAGTGFDYLSIFAVGRDRPLVYSADFMLMLMMLAMSRTEEGLRAPDHVAHELRHALSGVFPPYVDELTGRWTRSRLLRLMDKVSVLRRLVR